MMALLGGCSGESPTAPPPTAPPGGGGGSGTPPPTGASIVLAVSNPTPVIRSTSTITATVSQGGTAVPNGTAVEFSTNLGTFLDTATATTIRTTTNGVATATLTSAVPGTATVTARVNNVSQTTTIQWLAEPVIPPVPPPVITTITSVTPGSATPQGGQTVTIRGTNFQPPLRVFFGDIPAVILSSTPTEIRVLVPQIALGPTEQFREVTILVISESETPAEQRATSPEPFRYEVPILTPVIRDVAPSSGPNEGNTRITIFGEGFQAPVRAFFGTGGSAGGSLINQVELEILQVTFDRIIALTPPALGLGAALRDQQVTLRVLNQASGTDAVRPLAYRYGPGMQITAVGPTTGSALGGTRVRIDGWGFDEPVAVTIGGVGANVISVSGTQIIAETNAPIIENCDTNPDGPISVTNIEDGASAEFEGIFTFIVPRLQLLSVSPSVVTPGQQVTATVSGTSGNGRFRIRGSGETGAGVTVPSTRISYDRATQTAVYTFVVPATLDLDEVDCPAGGSRPATTFYDVAFEDFVTKCDDSLARALTINPAPTPELFVDPSSLTFTAVVGTSSSRTVTLVNTGGGTLTVTSVGPATPNPPFSNSVPSSTSLAPCGSAEFNVTFTPAAAGSFQGSVSIVTNGGNITVPLTGTATAAPPPGN